MKKQFIFWMLISLFMMSPSYAQENKEAEGNNASVADTSKVKQTALVFLLNPLCENKAIGEYVKKGILTKEEGNDITNIKKILNKIDTLYEADKIKEQLEKCELSTSDAKDKIITINGNLSEIKKIAKTIKNQEEVNTVYKELKYGPLSTSDAIVRMKDIKQKEDAELAQNNAAPNDPKTQKSEVKDESKTAVAGVAPTKDERKALNDSIAKLGKEIKDLKNENQNLRNQLTQIYTDNFKLKWNSLPFSLFNENRPTFIDDFNDYMKKLPEMADNTKLIPKDIKELYDDYLAYQEGERCINNQYNKQAVDSIRLIIRGIRDKMPDGSPKKEDLVKLNEQLYDYPATVELFQQVIEEVHNTRKPTAESTESWVNRILTNKAENVEYIQKIPWLNEQLEYYKKELIAGKKKNMENVERLENMFLHELLPQEQEPQPQEEQEPQPQEGQEPQPQELYGTPNPIQ